MNLCPLWYGVLAEIGAGQEVARWFFRVGGAAGEAVFCPLTNAMHYTVVGGLVTADTTRRQTALHVVVVTHAGIRVAGRSQQQKCFSMFHGADANLDLLTCS